MLPLPCSEPDRGDDAASPAAPLDELRRRIATLERRPASFADGGAQQAAAPWGFGLRQLDAVLPKGGLVPDGLHEAAGAAHGDSPAAATFLVALIARLRHRDGRDTVLLCQSREAAGDFGRPHGRGLRGLGLDPARLLLVEVRRDRDVLWAAEEGLRSKALAVVLAEAGTVGLTASRRLSLAAREGATPLLLLRGDGLVPASAAMSRWRVAPRPGAGDPLDPRAPGHPSWRLDLVRCRGGRPASFDVEWNRETGDFGLAAALADRPAAPVARRPQEPGHDATRKAG